MNRGPDSLNADASCHSGDSLYCDGQLTVTPSNKIERKSHSITDLADRTISCVVAPLVVSTHADGTSLGPGAACESGLLIPSISMRYLSIRLVMPSKAAAWVWTWPVRVRASRINSRSNSWTAFSSET